MPQGPSPLWKVQLVSQQATCRPRDERPQRSQAFLQARFSESGEEIRDLNARAILPLLANNRLEVTVTLCTRVVSAFGSYVALITRLAFRVRADTAKNKAHLLTLLILYTFLLSAPFYHSSLTLYHLYFLHLLSHFSLSTYVYFFHSCTTFFIQLHIFSKIWGFHCGDYEERRLLGCYAVWIL
jgi:hypothetical protein